MNGLLRGAVVLAVWIVLGLSSGGWCAEPAVAVVDSERVLKESRKAKLAKAEIDRQEGEFRTEIGQMQEKLKKLEEQFEAARQETHNKALSEAAIKEKMEEAEKKLVAMKEFEREIRKTVDQRRQQLMTQTLQMRKRFRDEARDAVRKYAQEKGIVLVIDSAKAAIPELQDVVMYRADPVDITGKILEILNGAEDGKEGGKQ